MIIQKLDDYYIVKIFKEKLEDFNPFDKSCIEKLFQKILKKLLKNYSIHGLIDADIYFDRLYGMIIELREVYDYFDDIDLKIHFQLDSVFLVEIEYDYFNKEGLDISIKLSKVCESNKIFIFISRQGKLLFNGIIKESHNDLHNDYNKFINEINTLTIEDFINNYYEDLKSFF